MKIKELKLLDRPISLWLLSIFLFAISFEGTLSFPFLLKSAGTLLQHMVAVSHALYVITGILIIIGLWLSYKATPIIVIVWGLASLGAALGGPLAFSKVGPAFPRTAIIVTLFIFLITAGLLIYTRYIIRKTRSL